MSTQNKSDQTLGQSVHEQLVKLGIETPCTFNSTISETKQLRELEKLYSKVHEIFGLDLTDDSLAETPKRISKVLVFEKLKGLDYANFPKMTTVENKFYDGMVSVNDMQLKSMCEHHWESIFGRVAISYIPSRGGKVLGLSKLSRLSNFFAARPIVQERYTAQVFEAMKFILGTEDVAVHVRGVHMCMYARGVEEACSNTTTTLLGGLYKSDVSCRAEFLDGIDITKSIFPE